jgi:hypothetical protein
VNPAKVVKGLIAQLRLPIEAWIERKTSLLPA